MGGEHTGCGRGGVSSSAMASTNQHLQPAYFQPGPLHEYTLLDSGEGWKLERFGARVVSRPDPQALWKRKLPKAEWDKADLVFERDTKSAGRGGRWRGTEEARRDWTMAWGDLHFVLKPTAFKHVGLFPEQAANWSWIKSMGRELQGVPGKGPPKLLNLFGYTGAASLVAARAGFEVTHVDASKTSVNWVRENLATSGMRQDSIRMIADDALVFAKREARRGIRYTGIVMDPPHYGRGPNGEKWQLEDNLAELLETARTLLAPRSFCALSTYAVGYSPLAFTNMFGDFQGGATEAGELVLPEGKGAGSGRLLPCGFCARWTRGFGGGEG